MFGICRKNKLDEVCKIDLVLIVNRESGKYTKVSFWRDGSRYSCIVRDGAMLENGTVLKEGMEVRYGDLLNIMLRV